MILWGFQVTQSASEAFPSSPLASRVLIYSFFPPLSRSETHFSSSSTTTSDSQEVSSSDNGPSALQQQLLLMMARRTRSEPPRVPCRTSVHMTCFYKQND